MPYHLIYQPFDVYTNPAERIVGFFKADKPAQIREELCLAPDAIAMELEAQTISEARQEVRELGFSC